MNRKPGGEGAGGNGLKVRPWFQRLMAGKNSQDLAFPEET
jgi:hypothetical protein